MTAPSQSAVELDQCSSRSVLVDTGPDRGLVALPRRRRDTLLARLQSSSLDDRLAAGEQPESSRLLAVRAAQLTSPSTRRRLARRWDDLIARARSPQTFLDPHVPISRSQIDAATVEIELVARSLRAHRPVSAAGVAMVVTLLTAPDSPVYRQGDGAGELAAALARALARM